MSELPQTPTLNWEKGPQTEALILPALVVTVLPQPLAQAKSAVERGLAGSPSPQTSRVLLRPGPNPVTPLGRSPPGGRVNYFDPVLG